MNNLRWRIALILVIVGACLWAIIPPGKKIRLGLDLKGGVHLVLRVNTEDALKLQTETSAERLREDVEKAGITGVTFTVLSPTQFQASGVPPAQDGLFRQNAAVTARTHALRFIVILRLSTPHQIPLPAGLLCAPAAGSSTSTPQ